VKHVVPHAKSKLLGEGTEPPPRDHERVIDVENDGDEETSHRPTPVEVERSSTPLLEGSRGEAAPTAHAKNTYGPSTR